MKKDDKYMESDLRKRVQAQKEMWMRERDAEKGRKEIQGEAANNNNRQFNPGQSYTSQFSGHSQSQLNINQNPSNAGSYQRQISPSGQSQGGSSSQANMDPQMMDRMFARMSKQLEEKYEVLNGKALEKMPKPELEQSLHEQVMSNTCPVCYELFLPPQNSPHILFPCGHTFCKLCIDRCARQKNKCPYCRKEISSMAPNISLQNLILSASARQKDYIEQLSAAREQMLAAKQLQKMHAPPGTENMETAQEYVDRFKMLDIKGTVMMEEARECHKYLEQTQQNIRVKQKLLDTLSNEKADCIARMTAMQKEMDLIAQFEQAEKATLNEMQQEQNKILQQAKFIKESLGPVRQEQEKLKHLVAATEPSFLSQIN